MLPEILAQIMDMPKERVAVRKPDSLEDVIGVPADFCTPDAVTPLGILKLAGAESLNFVNVTLNGQGLRLFNLGGLTVGDALLTAGIDARSLTGRPGLGMTLNINGQRRFIAGSHGQSGQIAINGRAATFSDPVVEGDVLTVEKGRDGESPTPSVADLVELPAAFSVWIDDNQYAIEPLIQVNESRVPATHKLNDRDQIVWSPADTLERVLHAANIELAAKRFEYIINGNEREYIVWPTFRLNGETAERTSPVKAGDRITIVPPAIPCLGALVGFDANEVVPVEVLFNGVPCQVPTRRFSLSLNGIPAELERAAPDKSCIEFSLSNACLPSLADVLLAAEFNPLDVPAAGGILVVLNGKVAEYTAIIKNGDRIDILTK